MATPRRLAALQLADNRSRTEATTAKTEIEQQRHFISLTIIASPVHQSIMWLLLLLAPLLPLACSMWVKLYIDGRELSDHDAIMKITLFETDVIDLIDEVIEKTKTRLGVAVCRLRVYAPQTTVPPPAGEAYKADDHVPAGMGTTREEPFIVVAQTPKMTPWERIEEDFRSYVRSVGRNTGEFNGLSLPDRANLFNAFQQQQQQQQQQNGE
eukprot:scaffold49056_cov47-Attheya_sp.AAC.4